MLRLLRSAQDSTADLGFEAIAVRGRATSPRAAIPQSLCKAMDNRWLAIDSRSAAETSVANRSNNMDAAKPEKSGDSQPQAARRASGARQYSRARNRPPKAARRAGVEASVNHVILGLTRRLAIMNIAQHGIEADFGKEHADTFRNVQYPDLRTDYALVNPPFNDSDWHHIDDDVRWQPSGARQTAKGSSQGERSGVYQLGVPLKGNANFAWVQHFIHHLAPNGIAGFVLANGSMSSNQSSEGDICSFVTSRKPVSLCRRKQTNILEVAA